jgi:hypothetical protein
MNPQRLENVVRAQIDTLRREGVIDGDLHATLLQQYPSSRWDFSTLGRWFLFFGAISAAGGLVVLGTTIFEFTLEKLAVVLGVVSAVCFFGGVKLGNRGLTWSSRSIELLGALTLIGLTFTLGVIYSSGSGNWPVLLLIDMFVLLPLAYLRRNVRVLVLIVIVFFTWFGGVTGYMSGWGAYFFGMNYPLRFFVVGLLMVGMSLIHRNAEQERLRTYEGFFKVWLSGGVFFSEMALWLMSLFGNFGNIWEGHRETSGELFFFGLLWASFNAALLWFGSRYQLRMLRGYAITFLIIQGYTLYFWKIAQHMGFVAATFVAGAATLGLVIYMESKRRAAKTNTPA